MLCRICYGFVCLLCAALHVFAQPAADSVRQPLPYLYPLELPPSMVAIFGECRPDHFHAGLDLRTGGKEDQPVFAIADGYVHRVKIEAGGYGNALYIIHPDGHMSVYAHLNEFFPDLEKYVRKKQYKTESWKQDMYFDPRQFPVSRGQYIALSGNTGASQGPHLHFEIRDAASDVLYNPLRFYPDLNDTRSPLITKLAIYDGDQSIYQQQPLLLNVIRKKNRLQLAKPAQVVAASRIYLGIVAQDVMEKVVGTVGVYAMTLYNDGHEVFSWKLDSIAYDQIRYLDAFTDYRTTFQGGPWIQLCHALPNDKLPVYRSANKTEGLLDLRDGQEHTVRIEVSDFRGNKSSLDFTVRSSRQQNMKHDCQHAFEPLLENEYKDSLVQCHFGDECFYDAICFKASVAPSPLPFSYRYLIHDPGVPLHRFFELKLKPKVDIPKHLQDKIVLVKQPSGKEKKPTAKAVPLIDGWVSTMVRDFGEYRIMIDTLAPVLKTSIKNNDSLHAKQRLTFTALEETSSVKTVRAELDGQWLRMVQQGNTFYYIMDKHFPQGTHTFSISISDENANTTTRSFTLTNTTTDE